MAYKKFITAFLFLAAFLFVGTLASFPQDDPYLLPPDLLESIRNEVSGERAWDMVSKISRFHRIRGAGEGSDYDRCVEWLADELRKIGLHEVRTKRYSADVCIRNCR